MVCQIINLNSAYQENSNFLIFYTFTPHSTRLDKMESANLDLVFNVVAVSPLT